MFTYSFFIIIHSTLFVRNAIFPYCTLVHVATLAQETRLASRTERLNGGNQRNSNLRKKARLSRCIPIIDGVLHDSATIRSAQCTLACKSERPA